MWISKKKWDALEKRVNLLEEKLLSKKYTVKKGDTLVGISLCEYGTEKGYEAIAEINGLSYEEILFPGQVLWLPQLKRLSFVFDKEIVTQKCRYFQRQGGERTLQ